jgi:DNA polymerase III subunit beta
MIEAETVVGSSMKVLCRRDEFAEKVALVSRAVSTRTAVQVLLGVLLRAEGGRLHLAATDMEVSLRASLEAEIEDEGAVVVPGRLLVDLARLLPAGELELEHRAEEGVVRVESGSASYRLHSYGIEDFPRLPDVDAAAISAVQPAALLETIAQVSRSASRDESRPVLTGILVRFDDGKLVMAATDSYRLSVRETAVSGGPADLEAIVPARALSELARIAAGVDTIELAVQENQIAFRAGDTTLTTRRIDGQFPNYKQLVPEAFEHEVRLPRVELLDVIRRTAVIAQRNSPVQLRFAEGELAVSVRAQDVGEARESLPVPWAGEPLEIGFNPAFLADGLESIGSDEVVFKLISSLRPAVLTGESPDFTYLIMPIRLPG